MILSGICRWPAYQVDTAPPAGHYLQSFSFPKMNISQKLNALFLGVGPALSRKLAAIGVRSCGDLRQVSLSQLQKKFGPRTGQTLFRFCRGLDDRPVRYEKERKSVSAEMNYNIRFKKVNPTLQSFSSIPSISPQSMNIFLQYQCRISWQETTFCGRLLRYHHAILDSLESLAVPPQRIFITSEFWCWFLPNCLVLPFYQVDEAESFLSNLSMEVQKRLQEAGLKGRRVTLKVMVRKEGAPVVPSKYGGHGICDHVAK